MRLEGQEEHHSTTPVPSLRAQAARDGAQRWLARFSPLLDDLSRLNADECRNRIQLVQSLRAEAPGTLSELERCAEPSDAELLTTLRQAVGELDGLASDLRRRLGALAPGDPQAEVDLDRIQEKLAEAAARREIGIVPGTEGRLEFQTSAPSVGAAIFMGLFSLGWLSFTTFHASFMIWGMWQAFGPVAIVLLLFYSIFWAVGIGMGYGAVRSASREWVELNGSDLIIRRRFLRWSREKKHRLGPDSEAHVALPNIRQNGSTGMEISIRDADGQEIRFGTGRPAFELERLAERINQHLRALHA